MAGVKTDLEEDVLYQYACRRGRGVDLFSHFGTKTMLAGPPLTLISILAWVIYGTGLATGLTTVCLMVFNLVLLVSGMWCYFNSRNKLRDLYTEHADSRHGRASVALAVVLEQIYYKNIFVMFYRLYQDFGFAQFMVDDKEPDSLLMNIGVYSNPFEDHGTQKRIKSLDNWPRIQEELKEFGVVIGK